MGSGFMRLSLDVFVSALAVYFAAVSLMIVF